MIGILDFNKDFRPDTINGGRIAVIHLQTKSIVESWSLRLIYNDSRDMLMKSGNILHIWLHYGSRKSRLPCSILLI